MQNNKDNKSYPLEMLLWNIAFPGFGQLLQSNYLKGILFIALEIIVNVMGNFNTIIVLSFHGKVQEAVAQTNYQWLMFYPCIYFFAIWDAYRDAGGGAKPYSFVPFVFSAYFVTVGLILSPTVKLFGIMPGPMWLPILFLPIGVVIGFIIQWLLRRFQTGRSA